MADDDDETVLFLSPPKETTGNMLSHAQCIIATDASGRLSIEMYICLTLT